MIFTRIVIATVATLAALAPAVARAQSSDHPHDAARAKRMADALERFSREPSAAESLEAAIRHFQVHPEAIETLAARLQSKAGAPVMVLSGSYHGERLDREALVGPATLRDLDDAASSDRFRGTALFGWDLPNAIFNTSELQTYSLTSIQMFLLRLVNGWHWLRQHLALRLYVDPPRDLRARAHLEIRIRELTTLLDSVTGRWFSQQLPEGSI